MSVSQGDDPDTVLVFSIDHQVRKAAKNQLAVCLIVPRPTLWILKDALNRGLDPLLESVGGSRIVISVLGRGFWMETKVNWRHEPSELPPSPPTRGSAPRVRSRYRGTDE